MAQRPTSRSTAGDAAQRWQTVLENRIPLAGGWLRVQSTLALIRLSLSGDVVATRILAQALDNHTDANIRQMARRHLSSGLPAGGLNAVWQVWAETRRPGVAALLLAQNRPASAPPDLRLMSALLLNLESVAQEVSPAQVVTLYAACSDADATIASRARFAITRLSKEESVAVLCQLWARKRDPLLESALAQAAYQPMQPAEVSVLVALKFNRLELVTRRGPDGIPALRAACQDADEELRARARFCLHNLQAQPSINALCAAWLEERDGLLESAMVQARYVASQPARLRLYSALKARRGDLAEKARPDGVPVLLEACADADAEIQTRARSALRALRASEAQEALCRAVIEQDQPLAKQICFECGYLPAQPEQRALFLFITEQWDKYESLDFDQRLLNAVYETSSPELRQRILRRVQQAGRTNFLNIVTGTDDRTRAARMSSIEAQLLVRVLSNNAEWERLWGLAQALALPLSVEIVRLLGQKNWQPREPLEREIFATLTKLAAGEMLYTGSELTQALPVAVQRAVLRVHGRVNGMAFAPSAPHLAIGSGGRRVAVWNYQNACMEKLWADFPHAIGEVTYTPGGQLLCGERSIQAESCAIYRLAGEQPSLIGSHAASVTVLEALDEQMVLSAGRDARAALWNIAGRSPLREQALTDWPRAACLSPDRTRLLLLHRSLELIDSQTLGTRLTFSPGRFHGSGRSVLRSAAFLPEKDQLLAGQFNGQVIHYQHGGNRIRARLLTEHPKPVECVLVLPQRPAVATAGAEGQVRIFTLPELQPCGQIDAPGGRLTSLHASPDGAFLATGSNQSRLTLWDLRVQDIPALFNTPAANILPSQMALVNTLCGYADRLPGAVIHALRYLQTLLQHRFRYDIELSDVPSIQVGEFDVFLD
jgi:hypothetical protein